MQYMLNALVLFTRKDRDVLIHELREVIGNDLALWDHAVH